MPKESSDDPKFIAFGSLFSRTVGGILANRMI